MDQKFVVFNLANERFGVPIESVEAILASREVTRIPRSPKAMLGVFDMRGSTLPVLDARRRFEFSDQTDGKNFIVIQTTRGRCALKVDAVDGIATLDESEIEAKHSMFERQGDPSVKAIGKQKDRLTVLLDVEHLVPSNLDAKLAA